jgi:hypothetical protein
LSTVPPAGWRRRRGRPGGSTPSCRLKRTGVLAAAEGGGTFSPTAVPTYALTALPLRPHVSAGGSYHCNPRVVRLRQYPGVGRMGRCARMRGACTPKGYSPYSHLGTSVRHYRTELCAGTSSARWGRPAHRRTARSARRGTSPRDCQALSLTGTRGTLGVLKDTPGYPRDCQALSLTGTRGTLGVLKGTPGYPRDCQALSLTEIPSGDRSPLLGFGGATPLAPWVCWRRTYSDEEGLPHCRQCPGDKNYTIVKVRSPTLP